MNSARVKAYLALATCELIWGASQPIVKPALSYINASQFLFLRYLFAAPFVIPLIVMGIRKYHFKKTDWLRILFVEGLGIFNLFLLYTGLQYVPAIQSALILQTRPIFITIASIIFLKEREEGHEWIGLILSMLGTFTILLVPYLFNTAGSPLFSFFGASLILLTNIIFTIDTLYVKKLYNTLPKSPIAGVHMWIGLIMFTLYLTSVGQLPSMATIMRPPVLLAALYMAIPGSIIALTLSLYGYSKIEASEAVLFNYLEPFVYIPMSLIWLKEGLTPAQIIGLLCIGFGVWWAERRPKKGHHKVAHGAPLLIQWKLAESPLPTARRR